MPTHPQRPSAVQLGCLGTILLLGACGGDSPTAPPPDGPSLSAAAAAGVPVCHRAGSAGSIITVPPAQLAAHLAHGDYLTSLAVSHVSGQPNDGAHFRRITDALAAARDGRLARGEERSAACRITITVAAGRFRGAGTEPTDHDVELFPLTVDVPDITLLGALQMRLDAAGRATGASVTGRVTVLAPAAGVTDVSAIVLAQGHPGGSAGRGLTVEGFAMEGPARFAVFSIRARGLIIRGNRFEPGFVVALDLRTTSAVVEHNQLRGSAACEICPAGPGVYRVSGNRVLAGSIEGIMTLADFSDVLASPPGVEQGVIPVSADVTTEITNNEVRGHRQLPGGSGIRIVGLGLLMSDTHGSVHATIHDNLLVNNSYGVMVEAGFPDPGTRLRADMDVTLGGNTIQRSCQTDLYVTFGRHSGTPGPPGPDDGPFLGHSTFQLTLNGDVQFSDAWFSNPPGFGNTLLVDGARIAHTTRQFIDYTSCPARTGAASSVASGAIGVR